MALIRQVHLHFNIRCRHVHSTLTERKGAVGYLYLISLYRPVTRRAKDIKHAYVCMYIGMYVFTYVCRYVCMNVCIMYVCIMYVCIFFLCGLLLAPLLHYNSNLQAFYLFTIVVTNNITVSFTQRLAPQVILN